jgi:hypothetical protein
MALRIAAIVVAAGLCTILALDAATGQPIVRWEDTGPGSKTALPSGSIAKHLFIGQIQMIASVLDLDHSFAVRLELSNGGVTELVLTPGLVELDAVQPRPIHIERLAVTALADRVRTDGYGRAGAVELQGLAAMTTRTEQEPVVDVSPNPAAAADPTQPATIVTMNTKTVVKTVPDESERSRTQMEAATIRHRARLDAQQIVDGALLDGRVAPGSRAAGAVYFKRETEATEVLARIVLPAATVEIPFTATKRRPVFGPRLITFR